ncbi:voltage-gated potassium channel [Dyadobacter jejuensis]|uniref:Voltage-gated potassium channel n=1 Tax=Dyadobacter jejuensis TaxID=1082580 RepID=A0A316ANZ9_9BACT|nr:potassium channel protein [Dyadobacter jejuensis]PWJ59198.1 voltage-gated potassium channel [Dyadobacter jejuensis]
MNRWFLIKKFIVPLLYLGVLTLFGTVGYRIIDGFSWVDSLYMTVITVSTVGYGEVNQLTYQGRIFTIVLIITSIGFVAYYLTFVTRLIADGEWSKEYKRFKQYKNLKKMENHVIVCGYGRNGGEACAILRDNQVPFVVIEKASKIEAHPGDIVLHADATRDEVLLEAGILKAKAIIIALPEDAANLFVVLTARQLSPDILIISRASYDQSVGKLKIAGANNVIMPDKISGAYMASLVLTPDVQEFVTLMSTQHNDHFQIAELEVHGKAHLGSLNLWLETGCTILGIKQLNGQYLRNPSPDYYTAQAERMLLMGSKKQLEEARKLLRSLA